MASEGEGSSTVTRATSKRLGRPERGAGDAPVQDSTPGCIDGGHELSSIEARDLTEASALNVSQLATAESASESAGIFRRRHAHVIRKTGGVVSPGSGNVGMDAVLLCSATPE